MEKISDHFDPEEFVNNIKTGAEKRALNTEQEKERIKQEIMYEFDDANSSAFWNKCFICIPLKTIKMLRYNMQNLETEKYVIRNKPAFFINLLKKQGLFPFPVILLFVSPLIYLMVHLLVLCSIPRVCMAPLLRVMQAFF